MRKRLMRAAAKPLNLLPAGVGAVTAAGLAVGGLPPVAIAVGALSLASWGALVAWDMVSAPSENPEPDPAAGIASPGLQAHLQSLMDVGGRIRARIDAHEGMLTPSLVELRAECQELIEAATGAALRGDTLVALLADVDRAALLAERDQRVREAREAGDPEVERALTAAAEAKTREIQTWQSLATLANRIAAELVAADAAMDELNVRVVRVTLEDPGAAEDGIGEPGQRVREQVKALASRLNGLERAAKATLEEVG